MFGTGIEPIQTARLREAGGVCSKSLILLTAQIYHYPASREGVKRLSLYPFFISSIHMGVRPNVLTPQPKVIDRKS